MNIYKFLKNEKVISLLKETGLILVSLSAGFAVWILLSLADII